MILDFDDAVQFFKLHKALMLFVNQKLKIVETPTKSRKIVSLPESDRLKVRNALVEHIDLIDAFVEANPYKFDSDELAIVGSWRNLVAGDFYILRFLKKHTIFLSGKEEPPIAYGVLGLSDPLEYVIQDPLPFFCKAVLLPFRDKIVYDGLLWGYNILIGPNMTRDLNRLYKESKERHGIVTSLPRQPETPGEAPKRAIAGKKRRKRGGEMVGRWRIVWMETWDQDFVDEEVEGYFEFDKNGGGEFQFGYVHGQLDCRQVERDGKPGVEFSWDGNDEMDPAQGRGWAALNGEEIEGRIFIHRGDDSAFRAVRKDR